MCAILADYARYPQLTSAFECCEHAVTLDGTGDMDLLVFTAGKGPTGTLNNAMTTIGNESILISV